MFVGAKVFCFHTIVFIQPQSTYTTSTIYLNGKATGKKFSNTQLLTAYFAQNYINVISAARIISLTKNKRLPINIYHFALNIF